MGAVASLRATLKKDGVKASVNDCVMYAAARALRAVPAVNATWDAATAQATASKTVDVAVAVAIDGGLITPIVRNADTKSLVAIGEVRTRDASGQLETKECIPSSFLSLCVKK